MRSISLFLSFFGLLLSVYGQRPPIDNLPAIGLEEAGFNLDSVNAFIPALDDFTQLDFRGLVVLKDNQAVIEWYYNSTERATINDIRSAGKSITSLLLGVAMKEGLVQNLDQDLYSFFPKEKYPTLNEDYKKIKLKDLLDMSSGLDADADDSDTPGHAMHWVYNDEWLEYILDVPLVNEPGEKFVYADINAALIGAVIEETSGMSLNDFAKEKVFDLMGITNYYWYTNASRQTVAAGTLFLSTLDFAKLGILVANEGKWADQQLVEAGYIDRLLTHKVFDLTEWWNIGDQYGMFWYKNQETINGKTVDYLWAAGNGGNQLVVVPKEKMVIALTSTAYGSRYGHARSRFVLNKVLGALE